MFKFTIRELLLLTVIVAMGVAWWVHWRETERRHARRCLELERLCLEWGQRYEKRSAYIEKLKESLRMELGINLAADQNGVGYRGFFRPAKLPPELETEP